MLQVDGGHSTNVAFEHSNKELVESLFLTKWWIMLPQKIIQGKKKSDLTTLKIVQRELDNNARGYFDIGLLDVLSSPLQFLTTWINYFYGIILSVLEPDKCESHSLNVV